MELLNKININEEALLIGESNFSVDAQNIEYYLKRVDITHPIDSIALITKAIEITNRFHSYFHFEQSFAYLLKAKVLAKLELADDMIMALNKAIFQDHVNYEAYKLLLNVTKLIGHSQYKQTSHEFERMGGKVEEEYNYMPQFVRESDYLAFAVGGRAVIDDLTKKLDEAIKHSITNQPILALNMLNTFEHKSHRYDIAKAICHFNLSNYQEALQAVSKAVVELEERHKAYHRNACYMYLTRAYIFYVNDQTALMNNDLVKADDLDSKIKHEYESLYH